MEQFAKYYDLDTSDAQRYLFIYRYWLMYIDLVLLYEITNDIDIIYISFYILFCWYQVSLIVNICEKWCAMWEFYRKYYEILILNIHKYSLIKCKKKTLVLDVYKNFDRKSFHQVWYAWDAKIITKHSVYIFFSFSFIA